MPTDRKEKILKAVLCVLLVLLTLLLALRDSFALPSIMNDEYGYWLSAASFAGYDWSDVASEILYYSYGYGLVLAPLMMLIKNPVLLYHAAQMLNALWLVGSFLLLYALTEKWFPKTGWQIRMAASFAAVLSVGNLCFLSYTWPEVFLFFLFLVTVYLVMKLEEKPSVLTALLLGLVCVFLYYVHQREIGILAAAALSVLYLAVKKKIKPVQALLFFAAVVLLFLGGQAVKSHLLATVWAGVSDKLADVNNAGGQTGKISYLLSFSGIARFVLSFCGKSLYLLAASAFLILPAIRRLWKRRTETGALFLLLSLLFTLAVASLFFIRSTDTNHLLYGRYTENLLGPFTAIGLLALQEKSLRAKETVLYGLIGAVLTAACVFAFYRLGMRVSNSGVNTAAFAILGDHMEDFWGIVCLSFAAFCILGLMLRGGRMRNAALASAAAALLFMVLGLSGSVRYHRILDFDGRMEAAEAAQAVIDKADAKAGGACRLLVVSHGDTYNNYAAPIQFLYPARHVEYLTQEEAKNLQEETGSGAAVLIVPSDYGETPAGFSEAGEKGMYRFYVYGN